MSPNDRKTDSLVVNASMARLHRTLERLGRSLMRGEVSVDDSMEMLREIAFDPGYEPAWSKIERDAGTRAGRVGVRL
ncbi:MAG: hypothetical protein LM573_06890 [Thermofilum sp.]|nr:hypothetical protein [Thermofilum sp.]